MCLSGLDLILARALSSLTCFEVVSCCGCVVYLDSAWFCAEKHQVHVASSDIFPFLACSVHVYFAILANTRDSGT